MNNNDFFICKKCGRKLQMKYLHKQGFCSDCCNYRISSESSEKSNVIESKTFKEPEKEFKIGDKNVLKKYNGHDSAVVIPEGIKRIGDKAFSGCKNLTSIMIPDSVTIIDNCAFEGCESLTSITIPDSVSRIGYKAFYGCGFKSVRIPDSVRSIHSYVFAGCRHLTSITIPDGVTSIESYAFSDCADLASITIPDSVKSIEPSAFVNTAYYNNNSNWQNGILYIGDYLIKAKKDISGSFTIKNGTKSIADCAFENCTGLTNITIPNSVTSIGDKAFGECINLSNISIPDSVTNIGENVLCNCTSLLSDDLMQLGSLKIEFSWPMSDATVFFTKQSVRVVWNDLRWVGPNGYYDGITGELYVPKEILIQNNSAVLEKYITDSLPFAKIYDIGVHFTEDSIYRWLEYYSRHPDEIINYK